ncbi:MAG: sulfatase-like hydrolase/transferase [Solirubrobacterales bacterium]|nr:sulfatase-like hydrolase/transferase [Solirubrobacterales bacterium]
MATQIGTRRVLLAGLAFAAALAAGATVHHDGSAAARASGERPNFVVVVTDDQDSSSFNPKVMPKTFRLLRDGGTQLTKFTIATPLCCPSRAAQLTGQYGHNNGVLSNGPGYQALRDPRNVLPAWLQRAGYRTAHVGRFLNGYKRGAGGPAAPAPGWDRWIGLTHMHYRDYELSIDGRTRVVRGDGPRQYVTRDLHRRTNAVLRELTGSGSPFYLQIDELAPHSDHLARRVCARSALPGPRGFAGIRGLPGVHLPANPARERSVADKPAYIRRLPRVDDAQREAIQRRMRCRAAAIHEADRGIGNVVSLLRRHGELGDTVFVFYSDNGFFDGQHRIAKSKGLPYEPSIRVPAMIRVPPQLLGARPPRRFRRPTSNIDVAPTILDLAGAEPCVGDGDCRRLDGRSIAAGLTGEQPWAADRPILLEVDQRGKIAGGTLACSYVGVRAGDQLFVDYESIVRKSREGCRPSSASEHYRLDRDPQENHNLWPARNHADRAEQRRLRRLTQRLETCSGNAAGPGPAPPNPCE